MLKVLAIEPHGDDCCCSFTSVLRGDFDVDLVTFAVRPSYGIENFYKSIRSVKYFNYDDLNFYQRPKVTTHEIHKLYLENSIDVRKYYIDKVIGKFPEYHEAVDKVSQKVVELIEANNYDIVIYPVGLNHPYHVVVSEGTSMAANLLGTSNRPVFIAYADKPYLANRYVREMYEHYKRYGDFIEIVSPKVDKEQEIRGILRDIYPTEQNMLRFSSEILLEGQDVYTLPTNVSTEFIKTFTDKLK